MPEYDRAGVVREPSGVTVTGIVPSSLYPTRDGRRVVIGANGESNFRRLMTVIGRSDLAADPGLAGNAARVARQAELDAAIAEWTAALDAAEVVERLAAAAVPCGGIASVADLVADPHLRERGLFETVPVGGRPLAVPAILPKLAATPGGSDWAGPELGAHNREIYVDWLGLAEGELAALVARGVV